MAGKPEKRKPTGRGKTGGGHDYLFVARNNTLVVVSGKTGATRTLGGKTASEVLDLLKKRQKAGQQIAKILKKQGYEIGPGQIVRIVEDED